MPRERNKNSTSSRFFKGVKSLLSYNRSHNNNNNSNNKNNDDQQQEIYTKEGVAVTLTTEFNHTSTSSITLLNPSLSFLPCQAVGSSCFENKAYVHYEPKKAQVALGINPDAKHTKSLKITVEQYAWLIQQIQEEQGVFSSIESIFNECWNRSPMLGIVSTSVSTNTKWLSRKLMRFVQQKKKNLMMLSVPQQCIFMLPKALLLQAATYIPMTKPLPPPLLHVQYHLLSNWPYQIISKSYKKRLTRYCRSIPLCAHELLAVIPTTNQEIQHEPSPPASVINSNNKPPVETCHIRCADCSVSTNNIKSVITPSSRLQDSSTKIAIVTDENGQLQQQQSIMFPVSFVQQYNSVTSNLLNQQQSSIQRQLQHQEQDEVTKRQALFMTSAIQSSSSTRRVAFDSFSKLQKPHAVSAFQYIPPDRTMSSSSISSISQYSGIEENVQEEQDQAMNINDENDDLTPQKYGYVAIDNENEEILVVFPGMPISQNLFKNTSFAAVPWLEIENNSGSFDHKKPEENESPWVLDCALTAWSRCEMKVVTLLMRLCGLMPIRYKVVIVGYSLGGAIAALCASSLRSTKLLLNRSITVCAIHSPRIGNQSFLTSLSNQNVETIRITHHRDLMAHLPTRTSGLLHIGDTTVILPTEEDDHDGYVVDNMSSPLIEDALGKTFSFKEFDLNIHSKVWDIQLDDKSNVCVIT